MMKVNPETHEQNYISTYLPLYIYIYDGLKNSIQICVETLYFNKMA